jgi:hypothetical protein
LDTTAGAEGQVRVEGATNTTAEEQAEKDIETNASVLLDLKCVV